MSNQLRTRSFRGMRLAKLGCSTHGRCIFYDTAIFQSANTIRLQNTNNIFLGNEKTKLWDAFFFRAVSGGEKYGKRNGWWGGYNV